VLGSPDLVLQGSLLRLSLTIVESWQVFGWGLSLSLWRTVDVVSLHFAVACFAST